MRTLVEEGVATFHEATDLRLEHWQVLQRPVQVRVLRYFHRHGLLEDTSTADMLTWQGTGGFIVALPPAVGSGPGPAALHAVRE